MRAIWNGTVIAESDDTVLVEGNHYFPDFAVRMEFMLPSETHTICPWKGQASYYSIQVGGDTNVDAAWYYPEPKQAARRIKGHTAFWKGVEIVD
jgi:uncharacterized protein (DUF427 family)